ncbi:MAG: thymidine phosphorylase [Firmicutes bacterium]|nr:thymidine phosphorylase [Bacillota bacterium]
MNTVELITKKRNGGELSREEIRYLVMGFTEGSIPDYQMSAFLMAVYFRGMSRQETIWLTQEMKMSGDIADLSWIHGIKIDKHSTGGVGDKTTLIIGPLAAACGVPVAKMSGRGLGFTGGTVDKMEAIPGFRTALAEEEFFGQVQRCGISVIGQTAHIAPADKKIYALRDVTATVENLSLITSSIMSKKLASGSDGILLDVKCGSGAFMKTEEDARSLAEMMVDIGRADGKKMLALITDMNQPLGNAGGNALEVREAIRVLRGEGPADITELSVALAGRMVFMGELADSAEDGIAKAGDALRSGAGLDKFREFVRGQGGDPAVAEDLSLLPLSELRMEIAAPRDGYITGIDAMTIGLASQHTGAGRQTKEDVIDHGAGILLHHKSGDKIRAGEALMTLYSAEASKLELAAAEAAKAVQIGDEAPVLPPLIRGSVGEEPVPENREKECGL